MKKSIIFGFSILLVINAQSIPIENDIPSTTISRLTSGLFDNEKLIIQQSFTMGTSLTGNNNLSYGLLKNEFQMRINPKLNVTGGIHLLQKNEAIQGQFQTINPEILYDINFQYQPWKNTWLEFSIRNFRYPQINSGRLPIND